MSSPGEKKWHTSHHTWGLTQLKLSNAKNAFCGKGRVQHTYPTQISLLKYMLTYIIYKENIMFLTTLRLMRV